MSTDRDVERIVRSWMDEGVTQLPDRVLDLVLDQIPATPQRRPPWSAWRFPPMHSSARAVVVAAVMVLVAVAAFGLLNRNGVGGPSATPTPIPTAGAAYPCALLTREEAAQAFKVIGPITATATYDGRYCFYSQRSIEVVSFSIGRGNAAAAFATLKSGSGLNAQAVPDIGDEALWLPTNYLVILKGDVLVQIAAMYATLSSADPLDAAKAAGAFIATRIGGPDDRPGVLAPTPDQGPTPSGPLTPGEQQNTSLFSPAFIWYVPQVPWQFDGETAVSLDLSGGVGAPRGLTVSSDVRLYTDPCDKTKGFFTPAAASALDLANAIANLPGLEASDVRGVTLDGHDGAQVDIARAASPGPCAGGGGHLRIMRVGPSLSDEASAAAQWRFSIITVNGTLVVFESWTTSPSFLLDAHRAELQQIIDTVHFL